MTETTNTYPAFGEPATKGDVLMAMAWTQALVLQAVQVALIAGSGDTTKTALAHESFVVELKDFSRKMDQIGGREV